MIDDIGGLLLVERYAPERPLSSGISARDVTSRYRGFDVIAWPGELVRDVPLDQGLAPVSELGTLLGYWRRLDATQVGLVFCSSSDEVDLPGFDLVGFDVGYFESEYNYFSVVLNEVLCGHVAQLVEFVSRLNRNLLFDLSSDAAWLMQSRAELISSGRRVDLERGEETMQVIAVYGVRR